MKTGFWMTAACVAGSLCLSTAALCQTPAKPAPSAKGKAVISSLTVTATVTQIDQQTRQVTLRAEDGQEYSFVAGAAVKNLAQVQKGDVVNATYTEAVAYEVKKGGKVDAAATVAGGAAPLGTKPAAAIGSKVTVTVAIAAIDTKVPSVTFKGPGGNSRTVKVKDPAKLQGVSVGDTVELTYVEAIALKVDKAAK